MSSSRAARARLFGMGVDLLSAREAAIKGMGLIGTTGGYIVTINPEMCMKSLDDRSFKDAVGNASLVVPDGSGVVWALKRLGYEAASKVPGIELAEAMIAACATRGVPVFLIGAKPGVAQRAAASLVLKYKGLVVAGVLDGYYKIDEEDQAVSSALDSGAGLVLAAMGAGKQEHFMEKACSRRNGIAMIGIGGSFDVFAGDVKRAPRIIRQLSLEWLYRGLTDVSRMKRLMKLPAFVAIVVTRPRLARDGR
jgi:N-acetylglucosaminyldiphosphoundecaprenol N-acetyl-beta-D-mannosaminyltransferase